MAIVQGVGSVKVLPSKGEWAISSETAQPCDKHRDRGLAGVRQRNAARWVPSNVTGVAKSTAS